MRLALASIVPQPDDDFCAGCRRRVFNECINRPGVPVAAAAG